jgi:hypothetical protein
MGSGRGARYLSIENDLFGCIVKGKAPLSMLILKGYGNKLVEIFVLSQRLSIKAK